MKYGAAGVATAGMFQFQARSREEEKVIATTRDLFFYLWRKRRRFLKNRVAKWYVLKTCPILKAFVLRSSEALFKCDV